MPSWSKVQIPDHPVATLVVVKDISPASSEKTVKDFFTFCGKIKEFELQKDDHSGKQIALILFEREPAAKTATLLTNALIDDSNITVEPYFKDAISIGSEDVHEGSQESKPKTRIIAEYLAAGYQLQDHVVSTALEYDEKYGVSDKVKTYLNHLQTTVKQLDEQYKVTETVTAKAGQIDEKYQVQDKVLATVETVKQHPVAQQFQGLATQTYTRVLAVHEDAKRIAAEKKAVAIAAQSTTVDSSKRGAEFPSRPARRAQYDSAALPRVGLPSKVLSGWGKSAD